MSDKEKQSAEVPGANDLGPATRLFRALAHEGRLQVLLALSRLGPLPAGTLAEISGLEQSALSHQLRLLRKERLVTSVRSGKQRIYQLHDYHVAHIIEDALIHVAEEG